LRQALKRAFLFLYIIPDKKKSTEFKELKGVTSVKENLNESKKTKSAIS